MEILFKHLEYYSLVESSKIEKEIFSHKTALSDADLKTNGEFKMDLRRTEFYQQLFYFLENFVSV